MAAKRWAIQEIFDITLIEPVSGQQVYCVLEDLKNSTFTNEEQEATVTGGKGNPELMIFNHSKKAMFSIGSATFLSDMLELQTGTAPVTGANTNWVAGEVLTVTSNTATLSSTPLGDSNEELGYAYVIGSDGTFSTELIQDTIVSSGKFTVSGLTVTFNTGDLPDNTKVYVKYNKTTSSNAITYSNYVNVFSKYVKLVADTTVMDCSGTLYNAQLIFYNAKVNGNFSFDLSSDGEPAIQNLEIKALKTCTSEKLWDLIIDDQ